MRQKRWILVSCEKENVNIKERNWEVKEVLKVDKKKQKKILEKV